MSKFKTADDVTTYPGVAFYPRPYHVQFGLDYRTTPLIPHVSMLFYPRVEHNQPSGADQHWHVPFTLRDAKRLRDWLDAYIRDREGILR